jgi:hypothetical protein
MSAHSSGAVVLALTAFDVWLSEFLIYLFLPETDARALLEKGTEEKYRMLFSRFHPQIKPDVAELVMAIGVRHEIVHHFPRLTVGAQYLPKWLPELEQRGLLLSHPGAPAIDYSLTEKLSSCALAYWSFRTIERSAEQLVSDASDNAARMNQVSLANFHAYRSVCAPERLLEFDRRMSAISSTNSATQERK